MTLDEWDKKYGSKKSTSGGTKKEVQSMTIDEWDKKYLKSAKTESDPDKAAMLSVMQNMTTPSQRTAYVEGLIGTGAIDGKDADTLSFLAQYSGYGKTPTVNIDKPITENDTELDEKTATSFAQRVYGGTPVKTPTTVGEAKQQLYSKAAGDYNKAYNEYLAQAAGSAQYNGSEESVDSMYNSLNSIYDEISELPNKKDYDHAAGLIEDRLKAYANLYGLKLHTADEYSDVNAEEARELAMMQNYELVKDYWAEKYADEIPTAAERAGDTLRSFSEETLGWMNIIWTGVKGAATNFGASDQMTYNAELAEKQKAIGEKGQRQTATHFLDSNYYLEEAKKYASDTTSFIIDLAKTSLEVTSDQAVNMVTGGKGSMIALALRSFGGTYYPSVASGMDEGEAFKLALERTAVEVISEKIGGLKVYGTTLTDKLSVFTKKIFPKVSSKLEGNYFWRTLVKGGGEEAAEELFGNVVNHYADYYMGFSDSLEWTEEEWSELLYEMAIAEIVGTVGANVEIGTGKILQNVNAKRQAEVTQTLTELNEILGEIAISNMAESGKITDEQANAMTAAKAETSTESIESGLNLEPMTYEEQEEYLRERYADALENDIMNESFVQTMAKQLKEGVPLEDMVKRADNFVQKETNLKVIEADIRAEYAEDIEAGIVDEATIDATIKAIRAGEDIPETLLQLDELVEMAREYAAGKENTNGEGTASIDGSLRRDAGLGAGEQAGGVQRSTAGAQGERAVEAGRSTGEAAGKGTERTARPKVSSKELGLAKGTDNKTLTVRKKKAEVKALEKAAKVEITAVNGKIEQETNDGKTITVSGINAGGKIVIRGDYAGATELQLAIHEVGHSYMDTDTKEKLREAVLTKMSDEDLERMANEYSLIWKGLYTRPSGVKTDEELAEYFDTHPEEYREFLAVYEEEIYCDALAGINRAQSPGAAKLTEAARTVFKAETGIDLDGIVAGKPTATEAKTETETEAKTEGARAPPEASYSADEEERYLEAVRAGDMKTAQAMVDAAAKAAGYTSPKLYHGGNDFGHTILDTSFSDDKLSYFATSDIATASSYTRGNSGVREIGTTDTTDRRDELIDIFENYEETDGIDYYWLDEVEDYFGARLHDDEAEILVTDIEQRAANSFNSPDFRFSETDKTKLFEILTRDNPGVYQFYGNEDFLLEIDGEARNWNDIPLTGEMEDDLNFTSWIGSGKTANTRQIAAWAKNNGYFGVIYRNITDFGGQSGDYTGVTDIYNFFYPQYQLKSADPVTYDDEGNIIPLSERFNSENEDIRYSAEEDYEIDGKKAVMSAERIDAEIEDSGAGKRTDYARKWITSINPSDFLSMTLGRKNQDRARFDTMPGDYDTTVNDYDYIEGGLKKSRQTPYLSIDIASGRVIGHEGRHRMRALEKAGINYAEIVVEFYDEGSLIKEINGYGNPAEIIENITVYNQRGTGQSTTLKNVIPLNNAYKEQIHSTYGADAAESYSVKYSAEEETKEYPTLIDANTGLYIARNVDGEYFGLTEDKDRAITDKRDIEKARKSVKFFRKKNITLEDATITKAVKKNAPYKADANEREKTRKAAERTAALVETGYFNSAARSDLWHYTVDDELVINPTAATELFTRIAKSLGAEEVHYSAKSGSKFGSSVYLKLGDTELRISDHELPATKQRERTATRWDGEIVWDETTSEEMATIQSKDAFADWVLDKFYNPEKDERLADYERYSAEEEERFNELYDVMADGRIRPKNVADLSTEDWTIIYKVTKKLGYGIRSAKEAKEVYSGYVGTGGFNKEQSDAIRAAYGAEANGAGTNPERAKAAKKEYGTTTDFAEAGYLLQDGYMLDFSGKREGGPSHTRSMDHREISRVFDSAEAYDTATAYMDAFIAEGNIRLMDTQGVTIGEIEPTAKQYTILKRFVERVLSKEDYFYLDLSNRAGYTIESREYSENDSAAKVINDIKYYFKNGELPYRSELQQYRFSPDEEMLPAEEVRRRKDVQKRANAMGLKALRQRIATLDAQIEGFEKTEGRTADMDDVLERMKLDKATYEEALAKKEAKSEAQKQKRKETAEAAREAAENLSPRLTTRRSREALRKRIFEIYGIQSGRQSVTETLDAFLDVWIAQGKIGERAIQTLENALIDLGEFRVQSIDSAAREFRNRVSNGRIYVSPETAEEFGDDWQAFRRRAFANRIYISTDRKSNYPGVDQWTKDLATGFGSTRFDETNDEKAQLEAIVDMAESGRDENLTVAGMADYLAELHGDEYANAYIEDIHKQLMEALKSFSASAKVEMATVKSNVFRDVRRAEDIRQRMERAENEKNIREMQQKTLKQLQWLKRNEQMLGADFQAKAKEILGDIDTIAVSVADAMNWSEKYQATWGDLAKMYRWAKENDDNFLPSADLEKIVTRIEGKKLEEMDAGTVEQIYKAAVALRTAYYNRNNVINDELHRQFTEVFSDAVADMKAAPKLKNMTGKARKFWDEQLNPINRIRRMFGWKEDSAGFQIFGQGLERGERATKRYVEQATQMLDDFFTEHAEWVSKADGQGEDSTWYELEVPELLEFRMGDKPIFGRTVKVYMTPMQKVYMYLESKNYDNLRHMVGGRTFVNKELYQDGKIEEAFAQGTTISLAPESVRKIVSDLTPEELELATLLDKYFNVFAKGEINRVSNILYGFDRAMTDNYAPIFTNANYNKAEPGIYQDGTAEGVGHMKTRVQGAKNPTYNISALQAFQKHVSQTSRFVGMAIPMQNAKTLLNWYGNGVSMQDHITHEWSQAELDALEEVMTELQAPTYQQQSEFASTLGKLMSRYIGGVFASNITVAAKVLASKPTAAIELGNEYYPSVKQQQEVDEEIISKYTSELDVRKRGLGTPELAALTLDESKYRKWVEAHTTTKYLLGGGLLQAADVYVTKTMWAWTENKVKAEYPELEVGSEEYYKKVAAIYENAINETQSMYDIMHRSNIMRDTNEITRSFTMFHTDSLQAMNLLRKREGQLRAAKQSGDTAKVTEAKHSLASAIGNVVLMTALVGVFDTLRAMWRKKDDDFRDEEGNLTFWSITSEELKMLMENASGMIIGLDAIVPAIEAALTDEDYYDHSVMAVEAMNDLLSGGIDFGKAFGSFVSGFADIVKNDGDVWQYLTEETDFRGALKDAAETILHYFGGIPVKNVERIITSTLGWIWPEMAAAYDGLWESGSKSDLAESKNLAADIKSLYDGRYDLTDDEAAELARLYEAGYKVAVIGDTPSSFSVDGETVTLSTADAQAYSNTMEKQLQLLGEILASEEYANATDEEKAAMLRRLYDYAADIAKSKLSDDYELSSYATSVLDWLDAGLTWAQIAAGNTTTNDKVQEYLDAGLSYDVADEVLQSIAELEPEYGETSVSAYQKVQAVAYMQISESDKEKALQIVYGKQSTKAIERYQIARKHNVLTADYADFLATLREIDVNGGSPTQDEFKQAVAQSGFSTEAAKEIWYTYWKSTSPWG